MRTSIDLVIPAYNVAGVIGITLQRIDEQQRPQHFDFHVYVFNDASTDSTATVLAELESAYAFLNVVTADTNVGRSEARNKGVAAGSGDIIIMLDADCRYTQNDAILEFVKDIENGADGVIGSVEIVGGRFWSRYMNRVVPARIEDLEEQGLMALGTTTNAAIRRTTFNAIGGYSTKYRKYGFEDKDFLIRLEQQTSRISVRPDIRVSHDDDLNLASVCSKFAEAGEFSAPVFRKQHPTEYAKLSYSHCDAETGAIRRFLRPLSGPTRKLARGIAELALALPLPFRLQSAFVRLAICSAYFDGTARYRRS